MDTIQHNSARLYNCDETGITVVQHKHTKILELKGKRQISSLQSAERRSLVTVVTCVSPSGHFIPPLLVFPKKNMKQELMNGMPTGSVHACHPSGCFPVVSSFHQTFKADKRRSCYLSTEQALFTHQEPGGHYFTQGNHVDIICLPPYSSHKMQLLDKAFMRPLKTLYCQEI